MNSPESEDTNQIKQQLRLTAAGGPGQPPVNLDAPANRFTVWYKNGYCNGYLCKGSAEYKAAAWELIGKYWMNEAVILDASGPDDRVTVVRCTVG